MHLPTLLGRKLLVGVALVASGVVAGGTVAAVSTANASNSGSSSAHADETPLTGDALSSVKAAVLDEYPDATFQRVETDSGGVYEAHITTADGDELTVALDETYAIIGARTGHGRHGRDGEGRDGKVGGADGTN